MGRKRPWQAITCLILPDQNKVNSRSFFTHEEALRWGADWMQEFGPANPFRPTVTVAHRETRDWPEGELAPENYLLEWVPKHKALLQITWPAKTPDEAMRQAAEAFGREGETVRRLVKVIAVAPGGDAALIGRDLGEIGTI